jgi:hypothetical protein
MGSVTAIRLVKIIRLNTTAWLQLYFFWGEGTGVLAEIAGILLNFVGIC